MAFTRATINLGSSREGTGVNAFLIKQGNTPARLALTFRGEMAATRFGWRAREPLTVMIGEGEHHGLIRIRLSQEDSNADAVPRGKGSRKHFIVRLGAQSAFVDRVEPSTPVQWEMVDGWIEIVLPKWADETSPRKQAASEPVARTPVASPALPTPAGRKVTAALMGDPPPGRRQMLDKIGSMKG